MPPIWLLWIVGTLIVTLVAGLFILTALFPRRTGQTPFCRKCRYNLTGLARKRCPECGEKLSSMNAVIIGSRTVRRPRLFTGLAILLLAAGVFGAWGIPALKNVRWYSYYPTWMLFRDADSAVLLDRLRGFSELEGRRKAGRLNERQMEQLLEFCLNEQARPTLRLNPGGRAIDLLGEFWREGRLSETQESQMFENSMRLSARARPSIVEGHFLATKLGVDVRIPEGLSVKLEVRTFSAAHPDGRRVFATDYRGISLPREFGMPIPGVTVDDPHAALVADVALFADGADPHDPPMRQFTKRFEFRPEMFPTEPPDYFKIRRSPDLDATVRSIIGGITPTLERWGSAENPPLRVKVDFSSPPPIGLAFEVVVEYGDETVRLGTFTVAPADDDLEKAVLAELPTPPPDTVTIILRSSKKVALLTVDLFEIWGGELRFDDLPVD